jgi:hypothetical protein
MKKLRIVRIAVIGLLLAGAVALVGCSRYNTAHESQGKGRGTELAGRSLEQGGRGRNNTAAAQEFRGSGGYGRQQENREYPGDQFRTEQFSRRGTGAGNGQAGSGQDGRGQRGQLAAGGSNGPEQSGKSVVEMGTIGNLSGTLSYDGSEWYLDTGKSLYILHFGNTAYVDSTGIDLREGEPIDVRGFVSGNEIAVAAARIDAQVYTFRNEDGMPLWAGNGRRDNQIVQPYDGQGGPNQPRGQGGGNGQGGRGQGFESEDGGFDRRGPGSGTEQPKGRGRGGDLDGSDQLPWWYQQPLEPESSQNPA